MLQQSNVTHFLYVLSTLKVYRIFIYDKTQFNLIQNYVSTLHVSLPF